MAYYTLPTANDTAGFLEMFTYVSNTATGGLFFASMLLVIWVITFIAMKGFSNARAFTFAGFFTTILSMFMAVLELINPRYMYLCIVLTMVGMVWLKLDAQ